ncbi:tumor necrosis factor receptor superfamily member 23-like isoform X1 [Dipodomys merriami]|uniref:tumor necrosis factor receptor superfamily member 23-like isoform X1 n=2 Tax=Dipodomys merriami TaxID=94247 RepID=UPI003855D15A
MAAGRARVRRWLLVLLIQVATTTQLRSERRAQLGRPEPCSPGEFWSDGRCCLLCPAGEYVSQACVSPHTRGSCVKCEPRTFTTSANGLPACQPCSTCGADQEMVVECSSTRNRVCRCRSGHFYLAPESIEFCAPCTKCPEGRPVLQQCSATANTVCSLDVLSKRNRWWLLSILLTLVVIAGNVLYVTKDGSQGSHV